MKSKIVFHDGMMDMPVKTGYVVRPCSELMYITYDSPDCFLHFSDNVIKVQTSLKYLMDNLPKEVFFLCDRPVVINMRYFNMYNRIERLITMNDGAKFALSRRRVRTFNSIRNNRP